MTPLSRGFRSSLKKITCIKSPQFTFTPRSLLPYVQCSNASVLGTYTISAFKFLRNEEDMTTFPLAFDKRSISGNIASEGRLNAHTTATVRGTRKNILLCAKAEVTRSRYHFISPKILRFSDDLEVDHR